MIIVNIVRRQNGHVTAELIKNNTKGARMAKMLKKHTRRLLKADKKPLASPGPGIIRGSGRE